MTGSCWYRYLILASLLTLGCQSGSGPDVPDPADVARARQVAGGLASGLLEKLNGAMAGGDTLAALAFCADSAQVFTARHQAEGVAVRRVGTRARNPMNVPNAEEQSFLEAFRLQKMQGKDLTDSAVVVRSTEGRKELLYMRPIAVAPLCLTCHGDVESMDPALRALLASRYPDDRATGYAAGDLRGAVSVRLPLP